MYYLGGSMYDKLSILKIPPNITKPFVRKNIAKMAEFSTKLDGFLSMELYYSLKNPTMCLYSLGWNNSRSAFKNTTSISTSEEYSTFKKGFEEKHSVQGEYLIHIYDLKESGKKVGKDTDEKLEKKQKLMHEDSKHTHPLTMPNGILEVVYFKTKSETELAEIDIAKTTPFLKAQPGFIYRKIIRSDSYYLDCVVWETLRDAETAAQLFIKNSLCQNFIKSIEVLYSDHMIKDFSYLNSTAQNQIKRYVVCDTKPALVDWKTIYNPKQYELSVLTDSKSYQKLHTNEQLQYFFL